MPLINGNVTTVGYLDLTKHALNNAQIQNLASAPSPAVLGQVYFDTGSGKLRVCTNATGPVWVDVGGGDMLKSENLSGLANYTTARANLGLAIGTDVEAHDTDLTTIAGLSPTNDDLLQRKAGAWTNRTMAQVKTDLVLAKGDVGLGNVDNTADTAKPVSTAQQTALDLKANLAGPIFTGVPAAPTASGGTNTTQLATTAFVSTAVGAIVASSDAMVFKGVIDCSANPNYPAADAGHLYKISVAGKIGGASGTNVEVGDSILCTTDGTASGTQAAVGAFWYVTQTNLEAASTTVAGFVELATLAEAEAGTDTVRAVTPASITNFPRTYSTLTGNGTGGLVYGTPGTGTGALLVTHNLGLANRDAFTWGLMLASSHTAEYCEITSIDANSVGLWGWEAAPASNAYYVTIQG